MIVFEHNCRENARSFDAPHSNWRLGMGFLLILVQISCSVFAGVYNEHLIKNVAGSDVHIMVQGQRRGFAFTFCDDLCTGDMCAGWNPEYYHHV